MKAFCPIPLLILILAIAPAVLPLHAQEAEKKDDATPVESKIDRILLYSDRALVVRQGRVEVPAGRSRVVFEGLPQKLIDHSVAASINGKSAPFAKIANIEVEPVYKTTFRDEEAKKANEALKGLQHEMRALNDRLAGVNADAAFASNIKIGTRPLGKPDEVRYLPLAPDAWKAAMDYFGEEYRSAAERRRKLAEDMDDLRARIVVASAKARMLLSYKTHLTKRVILEVASKKALTCELDVSYIVSDAAWFPRYDVRADLKKGTVEVVGYALARHESGEDWDGVELAFSAAEPARAADLPKLLSWRIKAAEPAPVQVVEYRKLAKRKAEHRRGAVVRRLQAAPAKPPSSSAGRSKLVWQKAQQLRSNLEQVEQAARAQKDVSAPQDGAARQRGAQAQTLSSALRLEKQVKLIERLDREQDMARKRGDWQRFYDANGEILYNVTQLDDAQQAQFSGLLGRNTFNLKMGKRQLESKKLSRGLILPVRSSRGYDYRWQAMRRESVPSDGALTKVVLFRRTFKAKFVYEIAPAKSKMAFLKTALRNTTPSPFLAGPVSVFLSADFVGESDLKTCAPTETVSLGLGADEAVFVERKTEEKRDTRGLLSGTYRYNVSTTITVRNGKQRPIDVAVYDQLPYTWDDDLKMSDPFFAPRPTRTKEVGKRPALLCWEMTLTPGAKEKIVAAYWYQHDADRRVALEEDGSVTW